MKYLADVLTFSRIVSAVGLLVWGLLDWLGAVNVNYSVALYIAMAAFLSDAFDGYAARRWPYTDEERAKIFWHRNEATSHAFDNLGDSLLYFSVVLLLTVNGTIHWMVGPILVILSAAIIATIEYLHKKRRSPWAERLDVAFGWTFGGTLTLGLVLMVRVASPDYWWVVVAAGAVFGAFIVWLKWDRIMNRPERRI